MGLQAVTRKEIRHTRRSYMFLGITALFVLWVTFLAAIQWVPTFYRDSQLSTATLAQMNAMKQSARYFVPAIGLMLGYAAVVTERDSGSYKLTLSLPLTRAEFICGKFLGRTAVLGTAILAGYGIAAVIAVTTYSSFSMRIAVLYTLLTLLFGAVYVSIGVGLSVFFQSRTKAIAAVVGLFAWFTLFWDVSLFVLQHVFVDSELPEGGLPNWIRFIGLLNPSNAFRAGGRAVAEEFSVITTLPEADAPFLQDWIGIVVLVVWLVVPLVVGHLRFRRIDIE
jgi:ABC-2 type transport system permease protein